MPLSFFGRTKDKLSLVIDINSSTVSGSIVSIRSGGSIAILSSAQLPFVVHKKMTGQTLLQSVDVALDTILKTLLDRHMGIGSVRVSLSASWFLSRTKNIRVEHEKPFIITRSFVNEVVRTEMADAAKELHSDEYAEKFGDDFEIIEQNIFHAKVNGYDLDNFIGKKTQVFDMSARVAICARSVIDTITESIFRRTHISSESVSFHTFPFLTFSLFRIFYPATDCLIMDVAGRTTTISLVYGDELSASVVFPVGTHFLLEQVGKMLEVSPEISASTLHLVLSGRADTELSDRVRTVVDAVEKEWAVHFEGALMALDQNIALPSKVFLMAENGLLPLYTDFIRIPKTDATDAFRRHVNVTAMTGDMLASFYGDNIHHQFDAHVIIPALATAQQSTG